MSMQEENTDFGKQLKSAREALNLSLQEVASRLNLSTRFISALEEEDLKQCGLPLTYLRGYLRSYSRLLNIPEVQISKVLEQFTPAPIAATTAPTTTDTLSLSALLCNNTLNNNSYLAKAATYLASLLLVISVTTWWYLHSDSPTNTVITLNQPMLLNTGQTELNHKATVSDISAALSQAPRSETLVSSMLPANNQLALVPALSNTPTQEESDNDDEQE